MLSVISFFSSAVLHFPPRSYHGETCFPFLAEQVCTGLRRGGSPGSFCSWELQRKYHNFLTECAAGEKFGMLRECCHLMLPIKSNSLGSQLCSNSKWRWVNIWFYCMGQVIKRFPHGMTKGSPKSTLQFSSDLNEMFICWPWCAPTVLHSRITCHSPTTWEPPSASRVSAFTPSCSLSWPGGVFWRDMRRSSTHCASSPLCCKSSSPYAVSFLWTLFCWSQMISLQCV